MIPRNEYLNQLIKWKEEKVIKVVTGIRRCGKSTLLSLFQEHLKDNGINKDQIIAINFEDLAYENLLDYKNLYQYIVDRLCKDKWTYIFLDEIQNVKEFQKAVDSLYIKDNVDIYITGANACMLSGELATLLSGRYIEISMLPFSFKEYLSCTNKNKEDAFIDYMNNGGFPFCASQSDKTKINQYLEGIYNTVIVKDIELRQNKKNDNKLVDIALVKTISKYLADVIGNQVTVKKITNYLISNSRKVSDHTVSDYIMALLETFMFYPVERYDMQGKEVLKTNKKYYIVDTGLRNTLVSKKSLDLGFVLENIVFLELKRRGYQVYVGKSYNKEIDFIADRNGKIEYFQISVDLKDEDTFNREISAFDKIKDNYQKTILTLDKYSVGNYNGVLVVNVIDWLLDDK